MAHWLLADCISEGARAMPNRDDEALVATIVLMRRLHLLSRSLGPQRSLLDCSLRSSS